MQGNPVFISNASSFSFLHPLLRSLFNFLTLPLPPHTEQVSRWWRYTPLPKQLEHFSCGSGTNTFPLPLQVWHFESFDGTPKRSSPVPWQNAHFTSISCFWTLPDFCFLIVFLVIFLILFLGRFALLKVWLDCCLPVIAWSDSDWQAGTTFAGIACWPCFFFFSMK